MRAPFDILADYERRSLGHAAARTVQAAADGAVWRGVAYRVGSRRLVSGFADVVEIVPVPAMAPVPGAQAWLLGVGNLRGNLLPVVDLKSFLEGERSALHENQRVLVVRQPGGDVAVLIDELYGQRSFGADDETDVDGLGEGRYAHFVQRAFRTGEQVWGVFDLDRLARTPEFRQAAA